MPAKKKTTNTELTSAQRKVLREAAASVNRAYSEARKAVAAAGIRRDQDETFCLQPPRNHCPSFKPPRQGFRCARPRCGHSFFRHNVF
jgi:hypothetical protein